MPGCLSLACSWESTSSGIKLGIAYGIFAVAYALMPQDALDDVDSCGDWHCWPRNRSQRLALVWIYPSFIVTCLLVVVAWQFALLTEFRLALRQHSSW